MAAGENDTYLAFAALHGPALSASAVPPHCWPSLWRKLENEVFDAGEYFGIMQVEEANEERNNEETGEELKRKSNLGNELCYKVIVTKENGLQASDCDSIFLIDHAWTYRVEHARQQLVQVPGLLHRMANLMGIDFHGEVPDEAVVNQVLEEMWRYNQTYQLSCGTAEEKVPVWYIMDEFGSRIQHSDEPTFATAPLFYMPQQIAYTILWPLRDLENGEEVTRDYAYGEMDCLIRKCRLLPWRSSELLNISCFINEPSDDHYQAILTENKEKLPASIKLPIYEKNKIFKVYTDLQQVRQNLSHPRFEFTDLEQEADILYIFSHFKDYRLHSYFPIHYDEFIPLFEKQYSEYSWKTVEEDIFKAFAELFRAACAKPAPLGICDYPSSRAVYAIDLMLKWESSGNGKQHMQPQILEVNFNPDCDRACKYHPSFFNDVFCTLFLDEPNNCHVTSIV